MNKSQKNAKQLRHNKKVMADLKMEGAKYALKLYRTAVEIVMGLGEKRMARIDEKFMELLDREEVYKDMEKDKEQKGKKK